jgi:ribose 5-phosphate isomerase RpiB
VAKEVLLSFMRATFSGEERHVRRLEKIQDLDLR